MKIFLEQADLTETEIVVRGELSSEQVQNIVGLLSGSQSSQKMFFFRDDKEYIFDLKDVVYFEALKNKVVAHIGTEIYSTRSKLYELEGSLRAKGFVRINKGTIVNVNRISSVEAEFSGNYIAYIKGGKERLYISRKYIKDFKKYVLEV